MTIRGEYTKTKVDRYIFLTKETVDQLKKWIDFKYRIRRICSRDKKTGKALEEYRKPEIKEDDLHFFCSKLSYKIILISEYFFTLI